MKNFLLYLSIFVLLILLFLPWGLRIFAKDLYKKEEKKKDVVESISCNKLNESLNISYLNGKTYSLVYSLSGNYLLDNGNNPQKEENELDLLKDLREYSTIDYNKVNNITKFSINFTVYSVFPEKLSSYTKEINSEIDLLSHNGFSCTKTSNAK